MKPAVSILALVAATVALAGPAAAQDRSAARGKQVFNVWCYGCHKPLLPSETPVAGTSSLERNYKGSKPAALEQRTDLMPDYVRFIVRHGTKSMPFTRRVEIPDSDLDALVAYLTQKK